MRLRNLIDDDSAVSPVIGVILMVAITVILAAVIASFVLGLGSSTEVAPTADFSFNYDADADNVTVSHSGGDNIRGDELFLRGEQLDVTTTESWNQNASSTDAATQSGSIQGKSAVVSGDSWEVDLDGSGSPSEYVIRVVWESTQGDTSSELAVDRGPDAS